MEDYDDISGYIRALQARLAEYMKEFCPTIHDPAIALDWLYNRGIVCWAMRHDLNDAA
jgi:hypothetical protein